MSSFLMTWSLFSLTLFLFTIYVINTSVLSPSAIFWLYNIVYFTFYEIFHGLVIPWRMVIPWKNNKNRFDQGPFYILKPTELLSGRYVLFLKW